MSQGGLVARSSIVSITLCLFWFTAVGCETANEPSSAAVGMIETAPPPVSIEMIGAEVPVSSIAPGVSEGEYYQQQIVYVESQEGADWLFEKTLQEYNELSEMYAQTKDASLLPRIGHLQSTLQATGDDVSEPFVMAFNSCTDVGGEPAATQVSCSGGGGSCICENNCTCIATGSGCSCICPGTSQM